MLSFKGTLKKMLANGKIYRVRRKQSLKYQLFRGVKIREGGSISASGFGPGGPNPRGGGGGGSKSAVTPARSVSSTCRQVNVIFNCRRCLRHL